MRGHQQLLEMRRRGMATSLVWLQIGRDSLRTWAGWPQWSGHAHVEVDPADNLATLDLRCLVGLTAMVCGFDDVDRVRQLHAACVAAGAKRVISSTYRRVRVDDLETIETIDSAA